MADIVELGIAATTAVANSVSVTIAQQVPSGSRVIAVVTTTGTGSLASVMSDSQGNSWSDQNDAFLNSSLNRIAIIDSVLTKTLNVGDTITFTPTAGSLSLTLQVFVINRLWASDGAAGGSSANQSTSTPSAGATGTLKQAQELVAAFWGYRGAGPPSFTPPTNYLQTGITSQLSSTVSGVVQITGSFAWIITTSNATTTPTATIGSSQLCAGVNQPYALPLFRGLGVNCQAIARASLV